MAANEVLIVGGGPTGLVTAMVLNSHKIPFRIISAATGPGTLSRAMAVQARTLELYRPFGLSEQAVNDGIHTLATRIRVPGSDGNPKTVASIPYAEMGTGLSAYPFILQLPQDQHERILVDKLAELGVKIHWNTTLESLEQTASGVSTVISGPNGQETQTYRYVVGADGAHSKVRHSIGVGFPGGTYDQSFYVTDVKLNGEWRDEVMVTVDASSLSLRLPIRNAGTTRLIGLVPHSIKDKEHVTFEDVRETAERLAGETVAEVNWFSPYHAHHRVAERYRKGDVFLAGDACHVHSPLGGQGMNTGIGDAFNLSWKLAAVIQGKASADILDTYETERRAFAETLVKTTDSIFTLMIANTWGGYLFRFWIWPLVMSIITRFKSAKVAAFKTVSQIEISYPLSKLTAGSGGQVKGGQRLPWVDYGQGKDNFADFDGLNWQLHVYGDVDVALGDLDWIPLRRFPYNAKASKAGLQNNSAYLIRPDGYIGLAMNRWDVNQLQQYVAKLQLRP